MTDYIFFGILNWHDRKQRPQEIPYHLSKNKKNRIFYIEPILTINLGAWYQVIDKPSDNLIVMRLSTIDEQTNPYQGRLTEKQSYFSSLAVNKIVSDFNLKEVTIVSQLPFWGDLFRRLPNYKRIYDCMDHHSGFANNAKNTDDLEKELIENVDGVITTSDSIFKKIQHDNKTIIRNGMNNNVFKTLETKSRDMSKGVVVGYFGAVDHWFDVELLLLLVSLRSDISFEIIGSVSKNIYDRLKVFSNVKLFGEVLHRDIPAIIINWNIGIIPFKITQLTLSTNPVKAYEYAALGIPVISTRLPEMELNPSFSRKIIGNVWEFNEAINSYLDDSDEEKSKRVDWARQNSWDQRSLDFENFCDSTLDTSKISIIILHYGSLGQTINCISSIDSSYRNVSLIIINNALDLDLQSRIDELNYQLEISIINPDRNLGFSGGVNLGLRNVQREYVVLMNNDAEVTSGFLYPMLRTLVQQTSIKITAPATDKSGNEAQIPIGKGPNSWKSLNLFKAANNGNYRVNYSLSFFCVLFEMKLIDEIGFLDEEYKVGMFEDDDFVRRVQLANYFVAICFDSYVYHEISSSFNKMESEERRKIFESNKKKYESKWGRWIPHKYLQRIPTVDDLVVDEDLSHLRINN
jgi:GT2 family glycosyltransferase/glycosyltransferase involved in cell wall biosynthesis